MLRASSQSSEEAVNLEAVMDGSGAGDVPAGAELIAMAEAVVDGGAQTITTAREALAQVLSVAAMIDAAAVASNFQRMVRISDSTGISLGGYEGGTVELRAELGIDGLARN